MEAGDNPYVELTSAFNKGRLRAILSSGQAVVFHRLAVMSKDGDWILQEDEEALGHVLGVLGSQGAHYRFGAPLDRRWLAGGWSSHLEHRAERLRLRTDFVTRPPRLSADELAQVWRAAESSEVPVIELEALAEIKKTNREKDYVVIGELARRMETPRSQLLYSRSARDLLRLAKEHGDLAEDLAELRPVLQRIGDGRDVLEQALDSERRALIRKNEVRLAKYREVMQGWSKIWPEVSAEIAALPLLEAHAKLVERATGVLPFAPATLGETS